MTTSLDVSPGVWLLTIALYVVLFVIDLVIVGRRPHVPTMQECVRWLSLYIGLGVLFGLALWAASDLNHATQYFAGWVTEYSLSVDNLFIFILIMTRFAVPEELRQIALGWGIVIALIMRAIFIALGAAIIEQFSWVFYIFGAFLVGTAVKLAREAGQPEEEYQENALVRWVGRVFKMTPDYHGPHLRVDVDGDRLWTPMLVVLVSLGTTDLLFALDSIPAIFGLTEEAYIVLAANVFALLGLRQLYFLLGGLLDRLVYLSTGLAVVLGFIGVKLILEALHTNSLSFINGGEPVHVWVPSTVFSLGFIVIVLAITAVLSLRASRRTEAA